MHLLNRQAIIYHHALVAHHFPISLPEILHANFRGPTCVINQQTSFIIVMRSSVRFYEFSSAELDTLSAILCFATFRACFQRHTIPADAQPLQFQQ